MFFLELYSNSISNYLLRLVFTPLIAIIIMQIIKAVILNFSEKDLPLIIRHKLGSLSSLIVTLFVINALWFVIIKINGFYSLSWHKFEFRLTNTYITLFPLLSAYIALITLYFITESKIKKQL